jgi:lycopene beta-cyclase
LHQEYAAITSARLDQVVQDRLSRAPGAVLLAGVDVQRVEPDGVVLADGTHLGAAVVVDARGPAPVAPGAPCGYQKFVGLEVELERTSAIEHPILMDATLPQRDGYRFVYLLPFAPRRLLVEDTYFSDHPSLDREALRAEVNGYLRTRGFETAQVLREEWGVLPMPWAPGTPRPVPGVLVAGYRGGWFHPGTGYSLPIAVRLAALVAALAPAPPFGSRLDALWRAHERNARFARLLNFLLFRGVRPDERWRIFARHYRMPEEAIRRFYALETTLGDRARILAGPPPRGLSLGALARSWREAWRT